MSKLVAVCGATGKQGGAVVDALKRLGGVSVLAITRNPDSPASRALVADGVQPVKADFDDPASLDAAFKGCDAVFAVTDHFAGAGGSAAREKQQGVNLADAASRAGVRHFLWSTLEDTRPALAGMRGPLQGDYTVPHFDAKHEVEVYARQKLGGALTPVLTSVFMDNLLPGGGMEPSKQPDGSYALFACCGGGVMGWCATADIGNVLAAVIRDGPAKWGGKTVPVAGEHATLAQVADTFSQLFGKKVVAATPPVDDYIQALVGFGVPEWQANDLGNMFLYYDHVPSAQTRPLEASRAIYPGMQSLHAFLTQHKDKFAQLFA